MTTMFLTEVEDMNKAIKAGFIYSVQFGEAGDSHPEPTCFFKFAVEARNYIKNNMHKHGMVLGRKHSGSLDNSKVLIDAMC